VSGADQEELRGVFARKGLAFPVLGSSNSSGGPRTKLDHLRDLLAGRPGSAALFVGDGGGDFQVAQALGIPFVYLAEMSEWREGRAVVAAAANAWIAESWSELLSWLTPAEDRRNR
jgi:phosphoglycolate phosphatase-like HAD superfamily hydrolase